MSRTQVVALAILLSAGAGAAHAAPCGAAVLVADVNTRFTELAAPAGYLPVGSRTTFSAYTSTVGRELWVTDGTAPGTVLLADLNPGGDGSFPQPIGNLGNLALYGTSVGLVVTDGTTAGSQVVATVAVDDAPGEVFAGQFYFAAFDPPTGSELWRTDGTAAGTRLFVDIAPGAADSRPGDFVPVGSWLYFRLLNGEIWRTDGTTAGTVRMLDCTVACANPYVNLALVGSDLFFVSGGDLWKLDTVSGLATLVRAGLDPPQLVPFAGAVFFAGHDATSFALWRSDGTAGGTTRIDPVFPLVFGTGNGRLFYTTQEVPPHELHVTDGTVAGTASLGFVVSDGEECGDECRLPTPLLGWGGGILFRGLDAQHGGELWTSDGSAAGTRLLVDLEPGRDWSGPIQIAQGGNAIYFSIHSSARGTPICRTDGSPLGTVAISPVTTDTQGQLDEYGLVSLGSDVLLAARAPALGCELWRSDGTTVGTVPVSDIVPGLEGSTPTGLTRHGNAVYFAARFRTATGSDLELWRSDGTAAGTSLVRDIEPGDSASSPHHFLSTDTGLYFAATEAATGTELWRTDGTAAGTGLVADLVPGASAGSDPVPLASLPGGLLFQGNGALDQLLYWTDGTPLGTWTLPMRQPLPYAVRLNGRLYVADSGDVWRTDGTPGGTSVVTSFGGAIELRGTANGLLYVATQTGLAAYDPIRNATTDLGAFDDVLKSAGSLGTTFYFSVRDGFSRALWKTDGTPAGTVELASGTGTSLTALGGELYYAREGIHLWRTDGTVAGTYAVAPGLSLYAGNSEPPLVPVGDRLYFLADHPATGRELYSLCVTREAAPLLRNTDARLPAPAAADLVPLRLSRDRYIDDFQSGTVDPPPIVTDATRPLVLYALDDGDATVLLAKTPSLGIVVELR